MVERKTSWKGINEHDLEAVFSVLPLQMIPAYSKH